MRKMYLLLVALLGLLSVRCDFKDSNEILEVDVTEKYPLKKFYLQDILDLEYIPLETTSDFLTQGRILDVTESKILMANSRSGDLFIFDRANGKALSKINRRGEGPEKYVFLMNALADDDKNELFVYDAFRRTMLVYDMSGDFKRSFKLGTEIILNQFHDFNSDYILCQNTYDPSMSQSVNSFFLLSKDDGGLTFLDIPYEKRISTSVMRKEGDMIYGNSPKNSQVVSSLEGWLLMEPSSDTIHIFQPDQELVPFCTRVPSIQDMRPEVFLFPAALTPEYCFMQSVEKKWDFENNEGFKSENLLLDRIKGTIHRYEIYNRDFEGQEIDLSMGSFHKNIVLALSMNPFDLIESNNSGKLEGRLKEIASGLGEEDNPVIMLAKPKKQLDHEGLRE